MTTPNLRLPPNPPGVRVLKDSEASRLDTSRASSWKKPTKGCKTCGDQRTFRTPRDRQEIPTATSEILTYDCDCKAQWILHRWMLNAGIGYYYQTRSWEDLHAAPPRALGAVLDYLDNSTASIASGQGLTLWSPSTGSGKTLAAVLALKSALTHGHEGYFVQFNEMIDYSTEGWRNVDERKWFNRKIRNTDVLVIDDIGRENPGRANVVEAMLDAVIRARVNDARPTIITTNYTPDQMRLGYGNNILSLLSEVNHEIDFSGPDYRSTRHAWVQADKTLGLSYPICVA